MLKRIVKILCLYVKQVEMGIQDRLNRKGLHLTMHKTLLHQSNCHMGEMAKES